MSRLTLDNLQPGLRPIDLHTGRLLRRHGDGDELVALAGALCSAELGAGNVCLHLDEVAGTEVPASGGLVLPGADTWCAALRDSPLVGDGSQPVPLVLDPSGRLYLYRYWSAERRLARGIADRLVPDPVTGPATLAGLFGDLFGDEAALHKQALAAAACLRSRFAVVTGGPGTGKTTLAARLICLFLAARPGLRIALAAPTGKAAKRLGGSIASALSSLPIPEEARPMLPREAVTVHRLLRYHGGADTVAYNAERPLPLELVLVDEASMVDLLLMDALVTALPPTCRLVLLGDSRQLASVDAGFVLGDVCTAARPEAVSPAMADWFAGVSGRSVEPDPSASPLDDAVVELTHSWRFHPDRGIGRLSAGINAGDTDEVLATLEDDPTGEVAWDDTPEKVVAGQIEFARSLCRKRSIDRALELLSTRSVLCAHREGPGSVGDINDRVEQELSRAGLIGRGRMYRGRPVLVSSNAYALELFNGDLGLVFSDEGALWACFARGDGSVSRLAPVRLPAHETAWAMTVHKSQGSEFDEVAVVLPETSSRVLSRELLYTAVTRARRRVVIAGSQESLLRAVTTTVRRRTGLQDALEKSLAETQTTKDPEP